MNLDVIHPCKLGPGMVVLGTVQTDAPTRPVQPLAAALTVERIDPVNDGETKGFFVDWKGGFRSQWYRLYDPHLQFMVLNA